MMMKPMRKTIRLASLSAACFLGAAFAASSTLAQDQGRISGDLQLRITDGEGKVHELPVLRQIVQLDAQGNFQWRGDALFEATTEIRKRLRKHAPDLVPGFNELALDLADEQDPAILVGRIGELLAKAEPELLERVQELAEAIFQDLASEIEKP